jgi:hypothetical protein
MFTELDDPRPPAPTRATLRRVQTRARVLRRRRRVASAAPVVVAVGAVSAASLRLRDEAPEQVDVSATVPDTAPSTAPPLDVTRGGQLELTVVPAGWEAVDDRVVNDPVGPRYERYLSFELASSTAVDPPVFTVRREELPASTIDELVAAPGIDVGAPDDEGVVRFEARDGSSAGFVVTDNLVVLVSASGSGLDAGEILDDVVFTVPSPTCVEGEVARTLPECSGFEALVLDDGSVEEVPRQIIELPSTTR